MDLSVLDRAMGVSDIGASVNPSIDEQAKARIGLAIERLANARLAAIVESSHDAIIGKSLDGTITDWNLGAEQIFGYPAEEAVGRPISILIPEDRLAEEEEIVTRITRGERIDHFDTLRRAKDGRIVSVSLTVSPIYDETGKIIGASKIARDISQQQRSNAALLESEGRLRAIVETAVDGIITIDERGSITSLNPAASKMFGYAPEEVIGRNINLFMPAPYREEHDTYLNNFKTTGIKKIIGIGREVTGRRKNGTVFPIDLSVSEIVLGERRIFTGIIRDITERRRAELDRDRLLKLMDFAKLFIRGPEDRITRWTRGAERLYGYSAEEAVGRITHELLKTRFPEPIGVIREKFAANGRWEGELTHTARDGREIVVASEWTLFAASGNEPPAVLEANIDITSRKAAERALRESEERFRTLFSSMSEGFCLCEVLFDAAGEPNDFRFLAVNPAYARSYGTSEEKIVGKTVKELLPDLEPYWIEVLSKPAITGEVVRYTNFAKDLGRYFDVYAFSPEKGKFAALSMDVTDRQTAKDALSRHVDALARSNVELERFAYIASHDLQEPLRTVSSFAGLLQRRHGKSLDREAEEYLHFITDGVGRMEKLIRDLLSYSRIDSKTSPFTSVNCDIIVRKVMDGLKASIASEAATVTVDPLPTVFGDATQLSQVFQNLLANAIKFRRMEEPPVIHVSAREEAQQWVFSVKDNGIGIAQEYFDRIFVIFQRLHTLEEYSGTGIGLSLCKKIIERHHGKVWLESTVGRGSTFHFSIPKTTG